MFPIPVADTINEIKARLSSLPGFDSGFVHYITKHIIHHLNSIKCSEKLDLSDPATRKWVEQVTDLFYLVDDLCADVALLQKQSNVLFARKCNLTLLRQLEQIEKKVKHVMKALKKNVKTLPKLDLKEKGDHYYYYKEIITEICLAKEEGVVLAVATFTIMENEETRPAKHVCEDEEVKRDFDVVTWIDVKQVGEKNYANHVVDRVNHDLDEKKKEKSAVGKGFLVVLDYFQNDLDPVGEEDKEEWLKLAEKLKKVAATSSSSGGGVLLVITTRLSVAQFVGSLFEPTLFRFDWLSPSQTLPRSSLERIARTIESLLDVPGGVISEATKIVATLVRSRKLISDEADINLLKEEFLQEMWLKHYQRFNLSDWRLKQCFAYSLFIFSSYYYVKIEMLVRLWMAQGFLRHFSSNELEDLGRQCINDLCNKSIFIDYGDGDLGLYSYMRDLAKVVIGNNGGKSWDKRKGVIDREGVLISPRLDDLKGIPESNKKVRSFILEEEQDWPPLAPNQVMLNRFACDAIFSAFKRLRVLTLKRLGIKVLSDSIGDLKSLRYLDLSYNNLKKVPVSIGELRYLQILLLSYCLKLKELPNDINHFASLRHLEVDHCPDLKHMPSALKKLTWLRSLPHFVASSQNGVRELTNLNEIRGRLEISHLERFKFKRSSRPVRSYLIEKQHLEGLSLRWNHDGKDKHSSEDNKQYQIMLERFQPHSNLKQLSIIGYRGNLFANWLSSLNNLVEISLYYCPNFESLSTLDLDNLERLSLVSLHSLQFIIDKGSASPKLERVKISDCPSLSSWWKWGAHKTTVFTAIKELVVEYCPKLVSMPLFPNLKELVLECSNMEPLLNTLRYNSAEQSPLSKLTQLTMVNLDEQQYPREEELLKNFTSLVSLEIRNCKRLKSIKGWKYLSSLETLHISNCTDIDLPMWGLETLTELVIRDIPDLKSLLGIKDLPCMTNLQIRNCPELTALPDDVYMDPFTIFIEDCPKLASLPKSFKNEIVMVIINCPLLKDWKPNLEF